MTKDDDPPDVPEPVPHAIPSIDLYPEDLARLIAAGVLPGHAVDPPSAKGSMRSKLLLAVLIAVVGAGASVMSCVGQSFSYRQARALEGIEQQLKAMSARCIKP